VRCTGEANYFKYYNSLGVIAKLATSYIGKPDPNDDMIIATARRANVASIVSRDDDLLALQQYQGPTIITPEAFMALVRERRRDTS